MLGSALEAETCGPAGRFGISTATLSVNLAELGVESALHSNVTFFSIPS